MKRTLPKSLVFPVLFFAFFLGSPDKAAAQAYDMIYQDTLTAATATFPIVMPHSFSFSLYQNCNPTPVNFSGLPVRFSYGAPAITQTVTGGFPLQAIGNPFCATQSPVCSISGPLNYQKSGFTYTFNVSANFSNPGIYTVGTEFMGFGSGFGSFQAANISGNFGIEPRVLNVIAPGLINVPPQFINPPVIFANVNQPTSYSIAAKDPDGDSLVYRLRAVSPNATYAPGFTPLNPITASPALVLNSRTGVITFTPTAYDATAGPGGTANKYVIGLDIEEYRKGNNGSFKIGTIQRNVLVNVISNSNNSPVLGASNNGVAVAPNTIIDVAPGTAVMLNFGASDPDAGDYVYPTSNVVSILPNATYGITLGQNPNGGILHWTPTVADVRPEPYFFNVTAIDDACPYPAAVTHTYGIRVGYLTGIGPDTFRPQLFSVFPNPFTQEVNFKITGKNKAETILIYNLLGQQIDKISIRNSGAGQQQITWGNAGKFAKGTYLAKLISEDQTVQTLRFIKQ